MAGAIDSLWGLSQPWAHRLMRLLQVLFYGHSHVAEVPAVARLEAWRTVDPRRALLARGPTEIIILLLLAI